MGIGWEVYWGGQKSTICGRLEETAGYIQVTSACKRIRSLNRRMQQPRLEMMTPLGFPWVKIKL